MIRKMKPESSSESSNFALLLNTQKNRTLLNSYVYVVLEWMYGYNQLQKPSLYACPQSPASRVSEKWNPLFLMMASDYETVSQLRYVTDFDSDTVETQANKFYHKIMSFSCAVLNKYYNSAKTVGGI